MRNLFMTLVLANLLLLAWQFWIDPSPPGPEVPGDQLGTGLALYGSAASSGPTGSRPEPARPPVPSAAAPSLLPAADARSCLRVGPLPTEAAAQQAGAVLSRQGIDAAPFARDAQLWLGHWVQIPGFTSVADAEAARQRLVAGGIPDAYLMQDGPQPIISLGVFRERSRADRVAAGARELGFGVSIRDRYRPTVEQWLLVRLATGQALSPEALELTGDRIMRTEPVSCDGAGSGQGPGPEGPLPTRPQ
jgi:hypothetical protein